MKTRRWTLRCAPLLLTAGLMLPAAGAYAGHGKEGIDPDNKDQSFNKVDLGSKASLAADKANLEIEPSVIATTWTNGEADVNIMDKDYDQNKWFGQTSCTDWNYNAIGFPTTCDDMDIKIDTENLGPYPQWMWNSTMCQEWGHTGDLGHRQASNDSNDNSCMRDDGDQSSFVNLDDHDVDAIAETF